ncbi:MAG: 4-(cytidine 5'-diphospho)-2-C-methyl-D-erythritol kinase [Actinomycetota bacterium]|nr:4-(cytidine 5'-diphospho)-2-C-methyl-D-erythritol kinase [Actinomycetota bacterium]
MRAEARAKVNLSLRVRPPRGGLHPLLSLVLSVGWWDGLEMETADEDLLDARGAPVPLGEANLVWKAISLLRRAGAQRPVQVRLDKHIPQAAGLGSGSADAAAALVLYARLTGFPEHRLRPLAEQVGADVPFCLEGGFMRMEGYGEQLTPLGYLPDDCWLGIVVPPLELQTAAVYRAWDRLEGPSGPAVAGRHLPPSLRAHGPLVNDLYPAAVALAPEVDDWRLELESRWDRPALLSGSGPALFSFFSAEDEAVAAVQVAPPTSRARRPAPPAAHGVVLP